MLVLLRKLAQENARVPQNQNEYRAKENGLIQRYDKASKRLTEVEGEIENRNTKRSQLQGFLKVLESRDILLTEFDDALWLGIVDRMKVDLDSGFTFVLKDGRISF